MAQNRAELLAHSVQRMKKTTPERSDAELSEDLKVVIDEITRALQRDAGLKVSSPLPGHSESASRHGSRRQLKGDPINIVALDFGSISEALGEVGGKQGLSFSAAEYQVFNQCLDAAVSAAIEQFFDQAQEQQEYVTNERMGFLAHELRNSLSSAKMSFELLKSGRVALNGRVGDIHNRSLDRLESLVNHLVNQTLLVAELRAGKIERKRLMVADFLRSTVETTVAERGIRIDVAVDEGLELDADERLLASAIGNLLQNAFKFTSENGTITVRARQEGDFVVIEVEDECGGLPPGNHEELFTSFVQRGTKRRGIGLGLAITREAIQAHGGTVTVRDLPGRGCIFSIRLRR